MSIFKKKFNCISCQIDKCKEQIMIFKQIMPTEIGLTFVCTLSSFGIIYLVRTFCFFRTHYLTHMREENFNDKEEKEEEENSIN